MVDIIDRLLRVVGHSPLPHIRGLLWRIRPPSSHRESVEFEIDFQGIRYRGRLDDLIDWNLFFFGSYSPAELDFLGRVAGILGKSSAALNYFDVGANVGQHVLYMSQRVASVVAFEPSLSARSQLEGNINRNNISNVRLFPVALGDSNGEGPLGSGFACNSGSRSLTWTLDDNNLETVSIHNGDELVRHENLPHMDILKLDVEGYEKKVLLGLRETLQRDRPVILMELIGETAKSGFQDVSDLQDSLYSEHVLFSLTGKQRANLTPFSWNNEAIVCLPREFASRFVSLLQPS